MGQRSRRLWLTEGDVAPTDLKFKELELDQNVFPTCLNQCGGSKGIDLRIGYSSTEKRQKKNALGRRTTRQNFITSHNFIPNCVTIAKARWDMNASHGQMKEE